MSYPDLAKVFWEHWDDLKRYSPEELAVGIARLDFMNAGVYEYVVTKESLFYRYLSDESRRDVYVIE